MQKTGTIVQILPTERGGYQSQNGYVYTFDMTIRCQDGEFTGEIGSKAQMYPANLGDGIVVEMAQSRYGLRFTKINPQQGGQQSYTPPPQAPPQQQSYTPPPQAPPQQNQRLPNKWDKPIDWHDKVQLYIVRQSSISNAIKFTEVEGTEPTVGVVLLIAKRFAQFVYDGIVPNQGGQPNPDYSENPAPPPGDDVPF